MGVNDDSSNVDDVEENSDTEDKNDDDTSQEGDAGDQGDDNQDGDQTKDDKKDDDDKSQTDGENDEPPVRKTKADFIKERLAKKAGSQADKAKKDDEADDDGEIAPEDEDLVDKVIQKRYGHILKGVEDEKEAQADREEANQFFSESPEFKPYEAKILKWWGDPTRRHLPISTVALEAVGYKNLIKIGAQKEREASDKSKQTKVTGNQNKGTGGSKSVNDMSFDEIRAMNQQVISKRGE